MRHCSPSNRTRKSDNKEDTCFSKSQLISIATKLKLNPGRKIKQDIVGMIRLKLSNQCPSGKDECFIPFTTPLINTRTLLLPQKPDGWRIDPRTWLSGDDIQDVMNQYELKYKTFKFIGVLPLDFNKRTGISTCISNELCDIDFTKLSEYQFGVVYNMDNHDEPGSHWVCLYINLNKKHKNYGLIYFDSVAAPIPGPIYDFCKLVISKHTSGKNEQSNKRQLTLKIIKKKKQYKNTECGMFCLHFLIQMLKGRSFKYMNEEPISDDDVFKLRSVLFR